VPAGFDLILIMALVERSVKLTETTRVRMSDMLIQE